MSKENEKYEIRYFKKKELANAIFKQGLRADKKVIETLKSNDFKDEDVLITTLERKSRFNVRHVQKFSKENLYNIDNTLNALCNS